MAALAESSYAPLRGRARKIVEEERYHAAHGIGWLRQLGRAGGATQALIAEVVAQIWPETLCLFGPDDDPLMSALHRAGVIGAPAGELRSQFLAQAHTALARAGLTPPPADGLPWARWTPRAGDLLGKKTLRAAPAARPRVL